MTDLDRIDCAIAAIENEMYLFSEDALQRIDTLRAEREKVLVDHRLEAK